MATFPLGAHGPWWWPGCPGESHLLLGFCRDFSPLLCMLDGWAVGTGSWRLGQVPAGSGEGVKGSAEGWAV